MNMEQRTIEHEPKDGESTAANVYVDSGMFDPFYKRIITIIGKWFDDTL